MQLGRVVDPDALATVEMFRRLLERKPASATQRLVAEVDGAVAAWAPSGLFESGVGWLFVGVLPEHRRRGIGSGLFDRMESRLRGLGATKLETSGTDDAGRRFLVARGFEVANVLHRSELDPRTAQASEPAAGVDIAPLRDVLDRAEELYRLYAECRADVPAADPRTAWTYDEWRAQTLDLSLLDHDTSVVLLDAGEPVSFAWLLSDRQGGRAETLMAGTRRDRRGQGLVTLAKAESARRAAELGISRILTYNDLDNAPMLAVNRRLGFRDKGTSETYAKRLGRAS